jgi:hypothetical protein
VYSSVFECTCCTTLSSKKGTAIVEDVHHFFKLSPNGVKFDSEFKYMFCIAGTTHSKDPNVAEVIPKFAKSLTIKGKQTPILIDFMEIAASLETLESLAKTNH